MPSEGSQSPEEVKGAAPPDINPFIVNFCRVLIERKGEELEGEAREKLLDDMYCLFERMLGRNMISSLPEGPRQEYLNLTKDLSNLSYEKIAEIFEQNAPDYERILKETMKEFGEIFMKNRTFKVEDYPVSA